MELWITDRIQLMLLQDDLHGALDTHDTRQALRPAPAGQQAKLDFRQAELRAGLIDDHAIIAGQGELHA